MRQILFKHNKQSAVFIIVLYYDDFRKFRMCQGKCGALYFSLLNFNRKFMSKPKAIFPLALLDTEEEYIQAMDFIVKEFIELKNPQIMHFAGTNRLIQAQVHLGMVLGDHLQKCINC